MSFIEHVRHKQCHPTPFRPTELWLRVIAFGVFFIVLAFIWPSWWVVLIAVLVTSMLVTHPFCYLSGKQHRPGGHWFHFEQD